MSVDNATVVVARPAASVHRDADGGFDVSDRGRRGRQPRPSDGSSAAVDAKTSVNGDDGNGDGDDGIAVDGDSGTAERTPLLHNRQSSSDGAGLVAEG